MVRRALGVGFTLDELVRILHVRDRGGAPCRQVRSLAESKLHEVERQIADLSRLRDHLRALLADWDHRLAGVPEGARAGLLEALSELPLEKRSTVKKLMATILFGACLVYGQDHQMGVNQRGDQVMGFWHEKATHHFRLYPDGGAIEVSANDPPGRGNPRPDPKCTCRTSRRCSRTETFAHPC